MDAAILVDALSLEDCSGAVAGARVLEMRAAVRAPRWATFASVGRDIAVVDMYLEESRRSG